MKCTVVHSTNCENSPKNALVEKIAIELICGEKINESVFADRIIIRNSSGEIECLKKDIKSAFQKTIQTKIRELVVENTISHGKTGFSSLKLINEHSTMYIGVLIEFTSASAKLVTRISLYDLL